MAARPGLRRIQHNPVLRPSFKQWMRSSASGTRRRATECLPLGAGGRLAPDRRTEGSGEAAAGAAGGWRRGATGKLSALPAGLALNRELQRVVTFNGKSGILSATGASARHPMVAPSRSFSVREPLMCQHPIMSRMCAKGAAGKVADRKTSPIHRFGRSTFSPRTPVRNSEGHDPVHGSRPRAHGPGGHHPERSDPAGSASPKLAFIGRPKI